MAKILQVDRQAGQAGGRAARAAAYLVWMGTAPPSGEKMRHRPPLPVRCRYRPYGGGRLRCTRAERCKAAVVAPRGSPEEWRELVVVDCLEQRRRVSRPEPRANGG